MKALRWAAALAAALLVPAASVEGQVSPEGRWRSFDTPHYVVHHPEGLEAMARRAAARAEEARALVAGALAPPPRGKVHLLVSDDLDVANGLAGVFPRNRIVIYAHAPADEPSLAYAHDWLELVVSHEVAHIHHLDHVSFPLAALRRVVGRHPITFPNATVPQWTTEGIATWLESRLTGAGRVHGTVHDMILRTAVLEDRFLPIDRVTGPPASWPGPNAAYVYGAAFADYLAERHGEDGGAAFVREIGGRWVPYRLDDAARRAFGVSFTRAWSAWEAELGARYRALADSLRAEGLTRPERLTRHGWTAASPRWSPDGTRIAYAAATGRAAPSTRILHPDGRVEEIAPRTTVGPLAWLPDGSGVVTAQLDGAGRTRVLSDLHRVGVDGSVRALSRGARLLEPDVRADGRIVAVRGGGAWSALVVAEADGSGVRTLVPSAEDVNWASPRWSPDGARVAAARWRTGGDYDVVVLDTLGRVVRELSADRALDLTPAWSPDGRYLVFSSDRTGIANLHAYDLERGTLHQVTELLSGAYQPDVSPDGRWIAFLWYSAEGYDVARIPFDPASWRAARPLRPEAAAPGPDPARYRVTAGGPSRPYSPLPTLLPTAWTPTLASDPELGVRVGAEVAGADVVGRHGYAAALTAAPRHGMWEGWAGYRYAGIGDPVLGGSVAQDWRVVLRRGTRLAGDSLPLETAMVLRERSASAVVSTLRPRFRSTAWLSAGGGVRHLRYGWLDPQTAPALDLPARPAEVGWVLSGGRSTARTYELSVGPHDGWLAAAALEGRRALRPLPGEADPRGYLRLSARTQGYLPLPGGGFARPVLAARLLAGADLGSRSPGFVAGGLHGGGIAPPLGTGLGIGSVLDFPVRGYPQGSQLGDRALAGSLEYRVPLALVERGYRLLPVYLDRAWGSAFVDGAAAWCSEDCPFATERAPRPLVSVGAEAGLDLRLFYHGRIPLVGGVALPLRALPGEARRGVQGYLRVGRSF